MLFLYSIGWGSGQGLDPDFGWHLRMGQVILAHGVPHTDPFSYTMPSYPFVDHEWLTNVFIATVYPLIGIIGLIILFTSLAYIALLLQCSMSLKKAMLIPLILCIGALSSYMGVRPQVISWVLFSLLLRILLYKRAWRKFRFFLPLLFLFWVNAHGSFPIGIGIVTLFLSYTFWEKKKIQIIDIIILLFSILVTFITPYGGRMWWEVWMQMSDNSLRWSIQEWLPAFFFVNYYLLLFLPFSLVLIGYTWKKFSFLETGLYILLLVFGLSSVRNIPFFLILALPMTIRANMYFERTIATIPFAVQRFHKACGIYFFLISMVILWQVVLPIVSHSTNFSASYYPKDATAYLQKHPSSGNIFSPYAWGGYLIWKLPQKKVFIDGRMPSWRRINAPFNESNNAFAESNAIVSGKEQFSIAKKKYQIDTVLLMNIPLEEKKSLPNILSNFFHLNQENLPYFIQQLQKLRMKEVYRDKTAVIYRIE
ncbi:MAG TPA: hypothetical protein VLF89_00515 [Candidatus Saccharimonadales bacterium]|nr:hypothetical protein [Candidatus Saccharimonadales bacterium]